MDGRLNHFHPASGAGSARHKPARRRPEGAFGRFRTTAKAPSGRFFAAANHREGALGAGLGVSEGAGGGPGQGFGGERGPVARGVSACSSFAHAAAALPAHQDFLVSRLPQTPLLGWAGLAPRVARAPNGLNAQEIPWSGQSPRFRKWPRKCARSRIIQTVRCTSGGPAWAGPRDWPRLRVGSARLRAGWSRGRGCARRWRPRWCRRRAPRPGSAASR
jgi:hypothetical protein